jgi:hypothetical protein
LAGFIPQHNSVNGPRGLRRGDSEVGIFHKVERKDISDKSNYIFSRAVVGLPLAFFLIMVLQGLSQEVIKQYLSTVTIRELTKKELSLLGY